MRAALAGDTRAFETLVKRYLGMVYAIAYARVGHTETAEDLVQEVFLRACLFVKDLRQPAPNRPLEETRKTPEPTVTPAPKVTSAPKTAIEPKVVKPVAAADDGPGWKIEAVDYGKGGEGVGCHDTTKGNMSASRRNVYRNDDVDIGSENLGGPH